MFPPEVASSPVDVMVAIWSEDTISESMALAQELRSAGLRVDLYPEADKLGKQFKYASSLGVAFVAVLGEEEAARGQVALKDMQSGEQHAVARANAAEFVRGVLGQRREGGK
jgi:histidyl-tRNA synthetase